ncbi:MAG TPA: ATP-binding protein [Vicinamibacterales bacterium]|nr:ATP-binding protein [Vicinamibacterales bacterium]
MSSIHRPPPPDPRETERRRRERARRHHVTRTVPLIRALGMNAILAAVFLHHYLVGPAVSTNQLWILAVAIEAYCGLSWLVLGTLWERFRPVLDLQFPLTVLDIMACGVATYATGGERSWLFFILLLRLTDLSLSFRHVLFLSHLVPLTYVAMLAYVAQVDGRAILTGPAVAKVFSLYGSGIYFALIARIAENLRAQLVAANRVGRDLVNQLEEKSARLEYSMNKAEEASRMKTQFLATVSHELRTPLTAVISRAEMVIDEADQERDAALIGDLRQITASAHQLNRIIGDVLNVAKMEAGKIPLRLERFDVAEIVDDAAWTIEPLGERAGIRVVVRQAAPLGTMYADRGKLRQILLKLLGNAIKFTEAGTVELDVQRVAGWNNRDQITFVVRDTGIGMTPEVQARLFTPFMQGDVSATRKYGGTGLGLVISRQFAEIMGGTLRPESTVGVGRVFTLTMPADVGPTPSPGPPGEPPVACAADGLPVGAP